MTTTRGRMHYLTVCPLNVTLHMIRQSGRGFDSSMVFSTFNLQPMTTKEETWKGSYIYRRSTSSSSLRLSCKFRRSLFLAALSTSFSSYWNIPEIWNSCPLLFAAH
ncbi:hypothetical protein Dimus_017071 [Dionaea muscipula]